MSQRRPVPRVVESDICIVGSGITAALAAEKLAAERTASIVVVEAGAETPPLDRWQALRRRYLRYGDSPWPADHLDGYEVDGLQSRSMQLGGLAMHWGGVTPRFSPEDFRLRSLFGVGDDWPISYEDLDPYYQEAEARMGVAGERGPREYDARTTDCPMPALPLSHNLTRLQQWGADAGIAFWSQPSAKNSVPYGGRAVCCRNDTCFPICPVGAKYSPDFTWNALRSSGAVRIFTETIVRRLELANGSERVERAVATTRSEPDRPIEFRAQTFVLAGGFTWTPHLLLLSTNSRFPDGLANRTGLVGKYLAGHRNVFAYVELPVRLYPGMNGQHSLMSHQFMRPPSAAPYVRHDLRIWESTVGREPRLRDDGGHLMLGDALLADWRGRTATGVARLRAYYDVLPHKESSCTIGRRRSPLGDPLPQLTFRDGAESAALRSQTEAQIHAVFDRMAKAGGGEVIRRGAQDFQDHPCGGTRMGNTADTGVCDSWGRTFDHENLFVIGAPTCVSASCCNGTLTFVALALRSAEEIGRSFPAIVPART